MEKLSEIDKNLKNQYDELVQCLKTIEFEVQFDIELEKNIDLEKTKNLNFSGIYLFEVFIEKKDKEDWVSDFVKKWEDDLFKRHWTPNTKKKRLKQQQDAKEWMPIYLGKCRNVGKRINEHFTLDLYKQTTAMKLLARENLHGYKFRISTIKIDVFTYDWIVPIAERELRNRYNPILGRQ
jgi:hypothetical protein